jgi:GDPmannose 4,6-dehydratase
MKKVLIIGALGQDGTILSSILSKKNYSIFGLCRKDSDISKISYHEQNFKTKFFTDDITNYESLRHLLNKIEPNIIVNFAGVTNVFDAWSNVENVYEQNCLIPMNILEYLKKENNDIFFFQSLSSLMYGNISAPIVENTCHNPLYPYGISKTFVHNNIKEYRKNFNIKCCGGIFFNHDSPYRGKNFLGKKISMTVSKILNGEDIKLNLGNLNGLRDLSHAEDFMNGVDLIIGSEINDDFIFSSNSLIRMRDYVKLFFTNFNLDYEKYIIEENSNIRSFEPENYGINDKLKSLGWEPKYNIAKLVNEMVNYELNNFGIY